MKYAILATATFLGTLSLISALAMEHLPEMTKVLAQASEACGIVALGLFMYYAITDTKDWLKETK